MLRRMLTLPQGIAGMLVLAFAVLLGTNYDPANFPQKDARYAETTAEAVAIYHQNEKNREEKQMVLFMIFGGLGFGLLMLANAAYTASRQLKQQAESADPNAPIQPE